MNTFILLWNPEISNFPYKDYCRQYLRNVGNIMSWNLFDYEAANPGDRVYWLRCGEGRTGILMAGSIYESPFEDVHWRDPEKRASYVPFLVEYAVDPEEMPIITTEMLRKEMPDFDWNDGHSGRLLNPEYAEKLEMMWAKYVFENGEAFNSKSIAACDDELLAKFQPANDIIQHYMTRVKGGTCEVCGYDFYKVFGEDVDSACEYDFLYHDGKVCENIEDNFHAFCPSCKSVLGIVDDLNQVEAKLGHKILVSCSEKMNIQINLK